MCGTDLEQNNHLKFVTEWYAEISDLKECDQLYNYFCLCVYTV